MGAVGDWRAGGGGAAVAAPALWLLAVPRSLRPPVPEWKTAASCNCPLPGCPPPLLPFQPFPGKAARVRSPPLADLQGSVFLTGPGASLDSGYLRPGHPGLGSFTERWFSPRAAPPAAKATFPGQGRVRGASTSPWRGQGSRGPRLLIYREKQRADPAGLRNVPRFSHL